MKKSLFFAFWLCFCAAVLAQMPMRPAFYTPVNDFANLLSSPQKEELSRLLRNHEQQQGEQLVFVTVQHLDGATVENFAQQLYNGWGIGKDGKGLLVLVSVQERKARVQVGQGLEGKWPLEKRELLLRNKLVPSLKNNDYYQAFWQTAQALTDQQLLEVSTFPAGLQEQPQIGSTDPQGADNSGWFVWFLVGIFALGFGLIIALIRGSASKKNTPLHAQNSHTSYKKSSASGGFIHYGHNYDPMIGSIDPTISGIDPSARHYNNSSSYDNSSNYDNSSSSYDNSSSYDSGSSNDSTSSSSDWGGGSSDSGSSSDY